MTTEAVRDQRRWHRIRVLLAMLVMAAFLAGAVPAEAHHPRSDGPTAAQTMACGGGDSRHVSGQIRAWAVDHTRMVDRQNITVRFNLWRWEGNRPVHVSSAVGQGWATDGSVGAMSSSFDYQGSYWPSWKTQVGQSGEYSMTAELWWHPEVRSSDAHGSESDFGITPAFSGDSGVRHETHQVRMGYTHQWLFSGVFHAGGHSTKSHKCSILFFN